MCSLNCRGSHHHTPPSRKGSGNFELFYWFGQFHVHALTWLPLSNPQILLLSSAAWVTQICIAGNAAPTVSE